MRKPEFMQMPIVLMMVRISLECDLCYAQCRSIAQNKCYFLHIFLPMSMVSFPICNLHILHFNNSLHAYFCFMCIQLIDSTEIIRLQRVLIAPLQQVQYLMNITYFKLLICCALILLILLTNVFLICMRFSKFFIIRSF